MTAAVLAVQHDLAGLFRAALLRAVDAGALALDPEASRASLERPRLPEHGDWATNVAMVLAKAAKAPPRAVAEAMVAHLELPDWVAGVEVAGPGFVNVRLDRRWFAGLVRRVLAEGDSFGAVDVGHGERVNVEFISANPTGPLHVGNARLAPTGDALANLLAATGHKVEREYYLNDAGSQLDRLGASVEAAYLPAGPAGRGAGRRVQGRLRRRPGRRAPRGAGRRPGRPGAGRAPLPHHRVVLPADGGGDPGDAGPPRGHVRRLVLRAHPPPERGHRRHRGRAARARPGRGPRRRRVAAHDRVRGRQGPAADPLHGAPTYLAADVVYYRDKRRRGFDRLIFLWGADHHGYIPRMRAVVRAFGDPDDTAEFLIGQLVSLVRAGQPAKMSKRSGDIVTVDDLIDEVGKDAFRYTMLRTSIDTPLEFDVEAVTRQSMDNPVYYVQYAHARISSVRRQGDEIGFTALPVDEADLGLLDHPMEAALLRRLAGFEELVVTAAAQRAPHRLTRYAEELAAAFHRFYGECRVLTDDQALSSARWWLVDATRQVLANTLALIGVDAPERM